MNEGNHKHRSEDVVRGPVIAVKNLIARYPVRALMACGLLSLTVPATRDSASSSIQSLIGVADEKWRQTFHPGYRGNGQYGNDGAIYYDEAVEKGYISPIK